MRVGIATGTMGYKHRELDGVVVTGFTPPVSN
jgi:acetoacetate decarboxylase